MLAALLTVARLVANYYLLIYGSTRGMYVKSFKMKAPTDSI